MQQQTLRKASDLSLDDDVSTKPSRGLSTILHDKDGQLSKPSTNTLKSIITLSTQGQMKLFSTKTNRFVKSYPTQLKNVITEAFAINKDCLYINGEDNHLLEYDFTKGIKKRDFGEGHKYWMSSMKSVVTSSNESFLFTGSFASIKQWDLSARNSQLA